jgi:hypothetical protein
MCQRGEWLNYSLVELESYSRILVTYSRSLGQLSFADGGGGTEANMKFARSILFSTVLVLIFMVPCSVRAQQWAGVVAPTRAVNWSGAGVTGGIPARTTICSTLNPGASASQISAAIAACPNNEVVFLNAGTYNLSGMIDFGGRSNATLRGAGANSTLLVFASGGSCVGAGADVCIAGSANYQGGPSNTANWTAGYAVGTTSITLSSASGLKVGSILTLDQNDDATDPGTIFVCQTTACSSEGPGGAGRPGRAQSQMVTVTAINGTTVTISPGLYMPNWRTSQAPGAWWGVTLTGDSVENLSIDNSASSGNSGIIIINATQSWVAGIRSIRADRSHVWLYLANECTVRDSYFFYTQNSASESYGVEMFQASDVLVENNIFQQVAAPIIANGSASGAVIGYNYTINDYYSPSLAWLAPGQFQHAAGTDMMLYEGNIGAGLEADQVHGTHHFTTAFRNYYNGWEVGKTAQTMPIHLQGVSRYYNIIGNVLGKSGFQTAYQCVPTSTSSSCSTPDMSIYALGFAGNEAQAGTYPNDLSVAQNVMRWGNYDTVNNAVRFVASEVPSGISQYSNPVPATQTLPKSFYQSGKPSWFGSIAYPPIGPDVTGGNLPSVGGFANMNPAMACYTNVMKGPSDGTGSVLTFNASACYSGTLVVVAPPTSLGAVAH